MDNNEIELVGGPCGHHGPYTFYKAFKYLKNGAKRVVSLCEFFFVKLWSDSDLVCIGELQLLWVDKNSEQMLASLRLYFLPENTPEGRIDHGEDEVLAITEKVVLKLEDLLTWITVDTEWTWGKSAFWEKEVDVPQDSEALVDKSSGLIDSTLDFSDVEKEKEIIVEDDALKIEDKEPSPKMVSKPSVIVLSYPRYCRYRSLMKRLEGVESRWLRHSLVVALGGFASTEKNTRVLFCRDTFDYPDLEGHELLCNHLAPKLKGRPRGKRKKRSISPGGSESNESEVSVHVGTSAIAKTRLTTQGGRNGLRCNSTTSPRRSTRSTENVEERDFLNKLHAHMKSHRTPIGRVPSIGYKEIDLFQFFKRVQKLGGYDNCTANRMWKTIFDELGGHHNSTSAATIMRRHYERLLLPYERHLKGQVHKPSTASERRRFKSKTSSFSDAETSENDRSSSGKSTPISTPTATPSTPTPTDFKDFSIPDKTKSEGKPSSLRSVRVKPDRLRENQQKDKSVPSASVTPKPEQITCTPTLPANLTSSLPEDSTNVPVTSAVAPVVEMPVPEKSVSPLEGKENVASMDNMSDSNVGQTRTDAEDQEDDVIEVPYKPATPEIIDLDDEPEPADEATSLTITSSSGSMVYDVKKRKLDILKEGGLEVTAITGFPEPLKDNRPSVIQHIIPPVTKSDISNLSITVTSDSRRMPPPIRIQRSQSPKKGNNNLINNRNTSSNSDSLSPKLSPALDVHLIGNTSNIFPLSASSKSLHNGSSNTPPKVLQSRSIYSYSERTVYGNPKDSFLPAVHATPTVPRHLHVRNNARPLGGEVLDLTIKSPQKPIVEIMRVPNISTLANLSTLTNNAGRSVKDLTSHQSTSSTNNNKHYSPKHNHNLQTGVPLLDARVGSNLEITLVSGTRSKRDALKPPVVPKVSTGGNNNHHRTQKRSSSGKFVNKPHMENGYIPTNSKNNSTNAANLVIPTPNNATSNGRLGLDQQNLSATNPFMSAASPLFPGYLSQLAAAASKGAPYLPVIDPIYYSAALAQAQGFYPSAAAHMYPPVPTMDHLQLYKDLMSHSPRGRFPFPLPPEASITSIAQSDHSNHMKK